MRQYFAKSFLLLLFSVIICCGIYPLALWSVGELFFPSQAHGSLLFNNQGKPLGSRLIGQSFTQNEFFQSRPSAAAYDASASASSTLAASNYALRDRVAHTLGPIVRFGNGPKAGQLIGADIESWFQQDLFQNSPHIVSKWANLHPTLAKAWLDSDANHKAYFNEWLISHASIISSSNDSSLGKASDPAVLFFENFSQENPSKFPRISIHEGAEGKQIIIMEPVSSGPEVQSIFFDMWRQDHPQVALQNVPGDMVLTSASGLDPHITLQNANYQLDRVALQWASDLKRNPDDVRKEIQLMLHKNARAPFAGISGEKFINVLELNLELSKRYGMPPKTL